MIKSLTVTHECIVGCPKCYGTGEGMYDGSRGCTECRGSGVLSNRGEVETELELEWSKSDLSDLEIIGESECEYCGMDMLEMAKEELEWELKHVQEC